MNKCRKDETYVVFRFESSADQPAIISSSYKRARHLLHRKQLLISISMAMFCNVFSRLANVTDLFSPNSLRGTYCSIKEEDGKLPVKENVTHIRSHGHFNCKNI